MPDVDGERYRAALSRSERGRTEWIEGVLEMAALLYRKRNELRSDPAFGAWLRDNAVNELHSHQDRAALIGLGGDPDLARRVLTQTERSSLRTIWDEAKGQFTSPGKLENSQSPPPAGDRQSIRDAVTALAKDRGTYGVTSGEAEADAGISLKGASAVLNQLATAGLLVKTSRKRPNPSGSMASIFVHRDFADAKPPRAKPRIEVVQHEIWQPPNFTREELGRPAPDEAHLPDPDRPGLTREQGYVARHGHVQVWPMQERKKRVIRRLPDLLRKLDQPLTELIDEGIQQVPDAEVIALLPAVANSDKARRRLIEALHAVRSNLERSWRYVENLEAALKAMPDHATDESTESADRTVVPIRA
jgi:hypothetical protein